DAAGQLARPDPRQELLLVGAEPFPPGEAMIAGLGRARRVPGTREAECAILLARYVAGLGLGRHLLQKLVKWARGRSVDRLFGDIPETNLPMRELADSMGFRLDPEAEVPAGLVRVVLDPGPDSAPPPPAAAGAHGPGAPRRLQWTAHAVVQTSRVLHSPASPAWPGPRLVERARLALRTGLAPGPGRPRPSWPDPVRGPRHAVRPPGRVRPAHPAGLRGRPSGGALPGLGDPALRPLQSASGHRQPAPGRAAAHAAAGARDRGGAGADPAAAPAPAALHLRQQLRPEGRPAPGPGRGEAAPGGGRLPQRAAGAGSGRLRRARRPARRLSDGRAGAAADRAAGRRDRFDPQLRPGKPAVAGPDRRGAHAARARDAHGRSQPGAGDGRPARALRRRYPAQRAV